MSDIRGFVLEITFGWLLVSVIAVMFLCLISFVAGYWNALTDLLPGRRP